MDREGHRSRTFRAGKIVLDDGGVFDCTIRDVSDTGARIRLNAPTPLPSRRFRLQFVSDKTERRVELRWQRGAEVGLVFLDDAGAGGAS